MDLREEIQIYLASTRHEADGVRRAFDPEVDPDGVVRGAEVQLERQRQAVMRRRLAQIEPSVILPVLRIATRMMRQPPGSPASSIEENDTVFANAADLIVECGDEAADPLLDALGDPDSNVQALGAMFLGTLVNAPSPAMTAAVATLLFEAIEQEAHLTIGAAAATIVFWKCVWSEGQIPIEAARFLLADYARRVLRDNPHLAPIHANWAHEAGASYANATLFLGRFPILISGW